MQVDLVAELPHYRDHLLPIWRAIPETLRGTDAGVGPAARNSDNILLVAGYSDVVRHPHRRCVYVEHGAGQSYLNLPASVAPFYSPLAFTKQHRNVVLFLCPNDEVTERWANVHNAVPAVTVGSPRLDAWHSGNRGQHESRTVAITFHWEPLSDVTSVVPELISAFGHYFRVLLDCVPRWQREGWTVIGHAHPKATAVKDFWLSEFGNSVKFVDQSSEILDRASILIADNTSLQAEMMSLGRGVVFLNHPAYRRDVEHGGRFWQWPCRSGVSIDTPASLGRLDLGSVPASTWHSFAYADGHAAERAAAAILSLL